MKEEERRLNELIPYLEELEKVHGTVILELAFATPDKQRSLSIPVKDWLQQIVHPHGLTLVEALWTMAITLKIKNKLVPE